MLPGDAITLADLPPQALVLVQVGEKSAGVCNPPFHLPVPAPMLHSKNLHFSYPATPDQPLFTGLSAHIIRRHAGVR
jgi:hypothetical protein